jgi:hypothetical protein
VLLPDWTVAARARPRSRVVAATLRRPACARAAAGLHTVAAFAPLERRRGTLHTAVTHHRRRPPTPLQVCPSMPPCRMKMLEIC